MSLLGDPAFNPATLSAAQQTRLSTMKSLITGAHKRTDRHPFKMPDTDNVWWMTHDLATCVAAMLLAFRITGDLWFLDTLHELHYDSSGGPYPAWRSMRQVLDTRYRGTSPEPGGATEGYSDGFLKWVVRDDNGTVQYKGTDLTVGYDLRANALSAQITWVMHLNRGLTSPKGYNYGAHADWYLNYHINHFEAKLRSRNSKPSGFPLFTNQPDSNIALPNWVRWHYYMGLLRNDAAYTAEARRLSDYYRQQLVTCADTVTPRGNAYVLMRANLLTQSPSYPNGFAQYLQPWSYSEFGYAAVIDLYFEGFYIWADPVHLQRFALQMSELAWKKTTWDAWHHDIGGGVPRCSMSPAPTTAGSPVNAFYYQNGSWGTLSAWDPPTSPLPALNEDARVWAVANGEDHHRILAAQFLHAHLVP
jgi:hypothetical protein